MSWAAAAARYQQLAQSVAAAAVATGRPPQAVRLIVAAKHQPAAALVALWDAGARHFGANLAAQLCSGRAALQAAGRPAHWHFIGQLQGNKVARIGAACTWVHSLSSFEHGQRLARQPPPTLVPQPAHLAPLEASAAAPRPVLVQVALQADVSRGGLQPAQLPRLLAQLAQLPQLQVVGLMAVPPQQADPAAAFAQVAAMLGVARRGPGGHRLRELSMGMSGDWPAAVAAGATIVRLGTAIFGPRRAQAH